MHVTYQMPWRSFVYTSRALRIACEPYAEKSNILLLTTMDPKNPSTSTSSSRAAVPGVSPSVHLQFTDTNLGKELNMEKYIRNYNDLYHEVEQADKLYEDQEELSKYED